MMMIYFSNKFIRNRALRAMLASETEPHENIRNTRYNFFIYCLPSNLPEIRVRVDHDDDRSGAKQEQRLNGRIRTLMMWKGWTWSKIMIYLFLLIIILPLRVPVMISIFIRVVSDDRKPPLLSLIVQPRTAVAGFSFSVILFHMQTCPLFCVIFISTII